MVRPSPLIYGDFTTNTLTFNGSVNITGSFTKGSGGFVQPHPSDATKEVVYAFFEGPEHAVFLRGKAKLLNGKATIEMSEHLRVVAGKDEDITVQLTPRYMDTFFGVDAFVKKWDGNVSKLLPTSRR
jgi:hypothetical protein